jgi:hypothetical protein
MFQAIPTTFSKHSVERGGNVMGLDREKENGIMLLFNIAVKGDASLEARAREKLRVTTSELQDFARKEGGLIDWQFLNYADFYQDPLGSYGEQNVERIRSMTRKVCFRRERQVGLRSQKFRFRLGRKMSYRYLLTEVTKQDPKCTARDFRPSYHVP